MNGTKDLWKSLKQICDVAEVIRADQEIDWDQVMQYILSSERMLLLSCFLASDLLRTFSRKSLARIQADPAVKSLAQQVRNAFP